MVVRSGWCGKHVGGSSNRYVGFVLLGMGGTFRSTVGLDFLRGVRGTVQMLVIADGPRIK